MKMDIAVTGQLRQVGDNDHLMIRLGRQSPQLATDHIAHATADA